MFSDVTILEIHLQDKGKTFGLICPKNLNLIYYNPFTNRSHKTIFLKQNSLFPDKLHDMNGYEIKVGFFHYPPYVIIKRNSSRNDMDVQGHDVNMIVSLSRVLNFSVDKVISDTSNLSRINCTPEYNSKIFRSLIYNEDELKAVQAARFTSCIDKYPEFRQCTTMIRYVFHLSILAQGAPMTMPDHVALADSKVLTL